MVGGLLQLVAFGAQDQLLLGNPRISFDDIFTDEDLMKEIMDYKGGINDIISKNKYRTFFNKAVYYGFKDSLVYLLEHGADVSIKCKYFNDPFYYSFDKYRFEIVNILFKYGILIEHKLDSIYDIASKIRACYEQGYLELCNYLIKKCNKCFLHMYYDYDELVYFVEHGAYINAEYRKRLENNAYTIVGNLNTITDFYGEYYDDPDYESDSEDDSEDSFYKYVEIDIDKDVQKNFQYIAKKLAQRRWTFVKCYTRLLGLHQRAVITANHPNRLKQLGVFENTSTVEDGASE